MPLAVERNRIGVLTTALAVSLATRILSLWKLHPLNWDEIEYYRASSWVWQGLVPYRDFWEHHTPLQWFVFAPVTAVARGPGAEAIIAMRVAQIPLWIVTFALLWWWMGRAGVGSVERCAVLVLALCSSFFMLAAVEFRIDVLGCLLVIAALVFAQHQAMGSAGAALALAGFSNIRLGPLLVAALIAFAIVRRDRALRLIAGAAVATAACALYFVITHSAAVAWQRVMIDNYLADRWTARQSTFLRRIAVPFGWTATGFDPAAVEPATIALFVLGIMGIVRALRQRESPLFTLAILQIVSLAFIAAMKFVFNYHFLIAIVLMLPFVAAELQRWRGSELVIALVIVISVANVAVVVFRGKEDDLRYQDRIMRDVERYTPPNGKVFDGAGWALRRQPAYRYWFLRAIVRTLEARGRFEPYQPVSPPSAFISDYGARVWLATHPPLRRYFTTHYLPVWRDLWLPGMSAVIPPGTGMTWRVPADGQYLVYASAALAAHPWFHDPIGTGSYARQNAYMRLSGGKAVTLRRGSSYTIASTDLRPVGVFIVPARLTELFRQPGENVDIDAAPPPRWHIPHLW